MTQKNKLLKGIIVLMCSFTLSLNAQETSEPQTEVMAYNSNETAAIGSINKTFSFKTESTNTDSRKSTVVKSFSSKIELYLIVETEKQIAIEAWMLSPFETADSNIYLKTETEEEIKLELWMTDLSFWESNSQNDTKK